MGVFSFSIFFLLAFAGGCLFPPESWGPFPFSLFFLLALAGGCLFHPAISYRKGGGGTSPFPFFFLALAGGCLWPDKLHLMGPIGRSLPHHLYSPADPPTTIQ